MQMTDSDRYDFIIHDVFTGGVEPMELFTASFLTGLGNLLTVDGTIAIVSSVPYLVTNGLCYMC